jgi:hypothetical protein
MLLPAIALASPSEQPSAPKRASIVVDFAPAANVPPWIASAFEHTLSRELSGFDRLAPVSKEDLSAHTCSGEASSEGETACRLRVYREAAIDIVLFGRVADGEIAYELYQTWTPARLSTGSIETGRGQSMVGLQQATRNVLNPVLKSGGLLDQRPHSFHRTASAADSSSGWSGAELAIVLALLVGLALPFGALALYVLIARAGSWSPIVRMKSARRVAVAAGVVALGAIALGPGRIAEVVASWPWVFAGIGGLLWGAFLVVAVRAIFPPLDGLPRIASHDLPRILLAWSLLCGERLVLLAALYAPVGWLALALGGWLGIAAPWDIVLVAPVMAFAARLWFASWIECIAVLLDRRLVDGPAAAHNPWSREVTDYLMGYVRRTGWDVDLDVLGSVLFLPGKPGTGIASYGGGSTHVRIVVDKQLLEMVIGPLVETKPDEKPALWPDWTTAVVVPRSGHPERRATTSSGEFRGRKVRTAYPGVQRKPLGQAATLLGYVFPEPGQIAPLISDNPRDLAVVRELLSEHYPWFAPDPDEEFDATDPTDKDLLFGALVRELGIVRRQESLFSTVKLLFGPRVARITSRQRSRIADAYAAMNFARHHLIQYVHYLRTRSTELLTARAKSDALHRTSMRILTQIDTVPKKGEAALVRRLVWLSRFFAEPVADPRTAKLRRLTAAAVIATLLVAAGVAVKRSLDYHAVYTQRIEAQERELAKSKQDAERDREKGTYGEVQEE